MKTSSRLLNPEPRATVVSVLAMGYWLECQFLQHFPIHGNRLQFSIPPTDQFRIITTHAGGQICPIWKFGCHGGAIPSILKIIRPLKGWIGNIHRDLLHEAENNWARLLGSPCQYWVPNKVAGEFIYAAVAKIIRTLGIFKRFRLCELAIKTPIKHTEYPQSHDYAF